MPWASIALALALALLFDFANGGGAGPTRKLDKESVYWYSFCQHFRRDLVGSPHMRPQVALAREHSATKIAGVILIGRQVELAIMSSSIRRIVE